MSEWQEAGVFSDDASSTWDRDSGPIQGVYTQKKTEVGRNKSNMYMIKKLTGETVGVWGSTVLDNKFEDIPLGAEVKIEYLGKQEGKSGQYHDYKVLFREVPLKEAVASPKAAKEPSPEPDDFFIDEEE